MRFNIHSGKYANYLMHSLLIGLGLLLPVFLSKSILILEDNLLVLSKILERLHTLENNQPFNLTVIVLTTADQVVEYVTGNPNAHFDVILLDRDCKIGKSFHILEIERFGAKKVIAISAVPEYNLEAKQRGVKRVVLKNQEKIDDFATKVVREVEKMITPSRLLRMRTSLFPITNHS